MKKIISILFLSMTFSCVGIDAGAEDPGQGPDAGEDDLSQRKNIETFLLAPDAGADDGRKGGETSHCNCN